MILKQAQTMIKLSNQDSIAINFTDEITEHNLFGNC